MQRMRQNLKIFELLLLTKLMATNNFVSRLALLRP
jgi:hypothetical protein